MKKIAFLFSLLLSTFCYAQSDANWDKAQHEVLASKKASTVRVWLAPSQEVTYPKYIDAYKVENQAGNELDESGIKSEPLLSVVSVYILSLGSECEVYERVIRVEAGQIRAIMPIKK